MNPLYKRCPKARMRYSDPGVYPINRWWQCDCHGVDDHTLLPASFDDALPGGWEAAIERARVELQVNIIGEQEGAEDLGEAFQFALLHLGWDGLIRRILVAAGEKV